MLENFSRKFITGLQLILRIFFESDAPAIEKN